MKKLIRGFTLLEVMIVLVIAAILLSLAIPSFSNLLRNNRLNTAVESFTNAVNFARTEALTKGRTVHFGPQANNDWSTGTIVWLDGVADNVFDAGDDEELRRWEKVPSDQVLAPVNAGLTFLAFNSTGLAAQSDNFTLCNGSTGEQGRRVLLTRGGSISIDKEYLCP